MTVDRKPEKKPDQECTEAQILERYKPFLFQQARKFSKHGIEIEDLVQEGSIAVLESFRAWKPDGGASVLTWIRRPVLFAMIKMAEAKKRSRFISASLDRSSGNMDGSKIEMDGEKHTLYDLIGDFEDRDDLIDFEKAVKTLSKREQTVVMLTEEGKFLYEIARTLNVSPELARLILKGAVKKIKAYLNKPPRHLRAV